MVRFLYEINPHARLIDKYEIESVCNNPLRYDPPRREMQESLQKKRILILFELVKRITK